MIDVVSVSDMSDEHLMLHLEKRHADELARAGMSFADGRERRMRNPSIWRTFHDTVHRLCPNDYDHEHRERES